MTKCEVCGTPFSWKRILKANLNYSAAACRECGTVHRITFFSRLIVTSLTVVPMLITGLISSPFENIFFNMLLALAVFTIGFLMVPFLVKYNVKGGWTTESRE